MIEYIKVVFTDGECKYYIGEDKKCKSDEDELIIHDNETAFLVAKWDKVKYVEIIKGSNTETEIPNDNTPTTRLL